MLSDRPHSSTSLRRGSGSSTSTSGSARGRWTSAPARVAPASAPRVPAAGAVAPPKRGLGEAVVAFRHRNFTLFWTGALVSNIGTWMQNITVPFALLYVMHTGPAWVGFATVSLLLPGVLL